MKKVILIALSLIIILGLMACDKSNEIPTTVAYANWVDSDVAFEGDENL